MSMTSVMKAIVIIKNGVTTNNKRQAKKDIDSPRILLDKNMI